MAIIDMIRKLNDLFVRICGHLAFAPALAARLAMGGTFAIAGWGKIHNIDGVVNYFRSIHIPSPEFQAPFAAYNEFICGSLLLAGLFTRFAAIPMIIVMVVAMTYDPDLHANWTNVGQAAGVGAAVEPFSKLVQVAELLNVILLAYLVVHGPGWLSVDALLSRMLGKAKPAAAAEGEKAKKD